MGQKQRKSSPQKGTIKDNLTFNLTSLLGYALYLPIAVPPPPPPPPPPLPPPPPPPLPPPTTTHHYHQLHLSLGCCYDTGGRVGGGGWVSLFCFVLEHVWGGWGREEAETSPLLSPPAPPPPTPAVPCIGKGDSLITVHTVHTHTHTHTYTHTKTNEFGQ